MAGHRRPADEEKVGCHAIAVAAANAGVVDVEVAIAGKHAFPDGHTCTAPRVDLAAFEPDGSDARPVFWEAKAYDSPVLHVAGELNGPRREYGAHRQRLVTSGEPWWRGSHHGSPENRSKTGWAPSLRGMHARAARRIDHRRMARATRSERTNIPAQVLRRPLGATAAPRSRLTGRICVHERFGVATTVLMAKLDWSRATPGRRDSTSLCRRS